MKQQLILAAVGALLAGSAHAAGVVSGVGAITESAGSISSPGAGQTSIVNAGTFIDGLYGTENQAYLVDDFAGGLNWSDNPIIKATIVVNDDGIVNGADQVAILGYFSDTAPGDGDYQANPATPHLRQQAQFGVSILGPGGGGDRVFLSIGGSLVGPVANWGSDFGGRNNPFDVDLTASEAGGVLTVTGTMSDASKTVIINSSGAIDPAAQLEAFGAAQGYLQVGVQRNYGVDFSNLQYTSTIPEPSTLGSLVMAMATLAGAMRCRR
ncbi:MAG: PEP-CTERM sorting domain-containing protein [Pirellulales bacterium]|nr:PEP-CTERM sorting domain-containing protein [Pirellulales bacterium]